ncbi:MAG: DNA polymerase I [Verrucomicrobia bacterium]|jgi:DNA polymerase I|nr:DNA polymerase I [Verrucomicrobiota bacterium]
MNLKAFKEIWVIDFEYQSLPGENPNPYCMVGLEVITGKFTRMDSTELRSTKVPPFEVTPENLVVAYYAPAEFSCFLELGWPCPANTLDLCAEFKWLKSGVQDGLRRDLVAALKHFGLDAVTPDAKDEWRELAIRGGPFTSVEMEGLMDYCAEDVQATAKLLKQMSPKVDLNRALLRGSYCWSVALMERSGVPVDTETLMLLKGQWSALQSGLIVATDKWGVYDGNTFKRDRFETFLKTHKLEWPRLDSGHLCLKEETFRQQAKAYPDLISPLYELRTTLGKLKLNSLAVGKDGRNRVMLSPFQSKTGRNQPSNSKFIFGPATWIRGLIKPDEGRAIAYIDWSQQELGIAARLSGDESMMEAYRSGDPYITFARMAGAVPEDGTKQSHPVERSRYKQCMLAVQYGMGAGSLSLTAGLALLDAKVLLQAHRDAFSDYWKWSELIERQGFGNGELRSTFGWRVLVDVDSRAASVKNFPVQANGAEMLRLAIMKMHTVGIQVIAPVHDAVMIEGASSEIETHTMKAQECMRWASQQILPGFPLDSDAMIVNYPNRYMDEDRGTVMWNKVMEIVGGPLYTH